MAPRFDAILNALRLAESAGIDARALRAAYQAYFDLIDAQDTRKARMLDKAARISHAVKLNHGVIDMPSLVQRFACSKETIYRLLAVSRDRETVTCDNDRRRGAHDGPSPGSNTSHTRNSTMSKLKDSSIALGGTPAPLSKYTTNHGSAKANGAGATENPRDNGGLSDGTTGGNNAAVAQMSKVALNASPAGSMPGSDAAKAAQKGNAA
jgi:hypothetical protein